MFVISASCCVSAAIMDDASKVMARSSAFETKEERPTRDYSTHITSDQLDGSNYASWSRGAHLTIIGRQIEADRVSHFLGGLNPLYNDVHSRSLALNSVHHPLENYDTVMEEDTRQSAMLEGNAMTLKVDPVRNLPVACQETMDHPLSHKPASSNGSHPRMGYHCNGDHYSKKCFKGHGYPNWFADYKACMGSNIWIIDTGASDHMTCDINIFDELSRTPQDPYITSANGLPSPVTGEGTVLDFKTPLDVLCAYTSPVSVSKLPPKVKILQIVALGFETIGREDDHDRSLGSETENSALCDKTTGLLKQATGRLGQLVLFLMIHAKTSLI
ncbi:hypothetical protein L3X38_040909 [Prunus dulcis]|uniref:Retrovirus-related Pol polyprotein from transposon TNT 1-94-like beta-barrel domain-containing protein n=1 Tax=Prunus dulcis TaxID=3755 RepID=A0AAD4YJS5_PRUDU|nr:hypothetical protein L3X38_040909 [Prunus dulcis]